MKFTYPITAIIITLFACTEKKLPILGNRDVQNKIINGKTATDTIYQTIPAFNFINQDSLPVNLTTVKGKIFVADFFFVACPTICPVMKKNLIKVYQKYNSNQNFLILSHTIDPEHDTLSVLKDYAQRIGSNRKNWQFIWGNRDEIYRIAEEGYFVSAAADKTAPGGFIHSGGLILVDPELRVRGIYDGTDDESVNKLINDIEILQREYKL